MFGRDWKKPEDYEDLRNAEPKQLAWEFLRRKKSYQKDYKIQSLVTDELEKTVVQFLDDLTSFDGTSKAPELGISFTEHFAQVCNSHGVLVPDTTLQHLGVIENYSKSKPLFDPLLMVINVWRWLADRHNLNPLTMVRRENIPAPEENLPRILANMFFPVTARLLARCKKSPLTLKANEVAAIFDVSKPIDDQLKAVERQLKRLQKKYKKTGKPPLSPYSEKKPSVTIRRKQISNQVEYLRLLDAEAAGASQSEMLDFIFPGQAKKRDEELRFSKKSEKSLWSNHFLKGKISIARSYRDKKYNEIASLPI